MCSRPVDVKSAIRLREKAVLFAVLAMVVLARADETEVGAANLTWTETGAATWEQGSWATASGDAVSWTDGSAATLASNGTATVSIGDVVKASGLTFSDYGRALAVEGGTLELADGATVTKESDFGVVVSSALPFEHQDVPNATDARQATCVSGERAVTYNLHGGLGGGSSASSFSGTNVVYWRNRKLSDITGFVSADFYRRTGAKRLGAQPFFYENDGTTASVQFQYKESDSSTFVSKIEFTQQSEDILARIVFWRSRKIPYGEDCDVGTQAQYGEINIGGQTIWDDISTSEGGNWTVANIIAKEKVKDITIVSKDGADDPAFANPGFLPALEAMSYSGAKTLLWKNRNLADIEFKSAFSRNASGGTQRQALPYNRKVEKDGRTSVQFRFYYNSSGGVLCIKVYFTQEGDDIYAQIGRVGARTVDINRDWDDADMGFPGYMSRVYDGVLTTSSGWGLADIKATRKTVAPLELSGVDTLPTQLAISTGEVKVTSGADFAFDQGTISGDGTLHFVGGTLTQTATASNGLTGKLILDGTKALVQGVKLSKFVGSGAEIELVNSAELSTTNTTNGSIGGSSSGVKMYVGPGSKYTQNAGGNMTLDYVSVTVDGGRVEMKGNSSTYIEDLTVRNGAEVVANDRTGAFWFGRRYPTPVLTCDGESEVTLAAQFRVFKNENSSWSPDVQYLTVNTLADLRLTGGFMMAEQGEKLNGLRIRKKGPARLIFDYSQDDFPETEYAYTLEQCVDEGALELAQSNAIAPTQPVSLYGDGALLVDAGTVNAGGALTVGGTNVVGIVGNGKISFASATFADGTRLNITGAVDTTSFRIGTDRCLSASALSKIRINGLGVGQDSNGYIAILGFAISIR